MKSILYIVTILLGLTFTACSQTSTKESNGSYNDISIESFNSEVNKQNIVILDVRTPGEVNEGKVEGAIHINYYDKDFLNQVENTISKDKKVYIYCKAGGRSASATKALSAKGYNANNILGGMDEWLNQGLPVSK